MGRTWALALAGSLLIVSAASADLALPKNIKQINPRVRFEGVEKHDDLVFVLRYKTFNGGPGRTPYTLVKVKDSSPFTMKVQRRLIDTALLAVPRKGFDKQAKDGPSLKWLTDKTEGVLTAKLTGISTTMPITVKEVPVTTFRVALKDGKLTADLVKDRKRSEAPAGPLPPWALGVVMALSLAWFGVWFARRGQGRADSPASAEGDKP